jgi:conjugal transfer pilus assembly protein TraK
MAGFMSPTRKRSIPMIHLTAKNKVFVKLFAILAMSLATHANALQILQGDDGSTLYVKISKKEMTRLSIEQGRVVTLRVKEGEINIDPDDETGQIFLTVPEGVNKPINGFLTTDLGRTYTIIFQPTDMPSDSIVIKQAKPKSKQVVREPKGNTHDKVVKRLVTVMANDELPDDIEIKEIGKPLALWKEATMMLERQYSTEGMVGERYSVANVSKETMVLDEREFYRKGVSVVAIEQLNVTPGSATRVYVIREKAENE